jgi:hypothetical protein
MAEVVLDRGLVRAVAVGHLAGQCERVVVEDERARPGEVEVGDDVGVGQVDAAVDDADDNALAGRPGVGRGVRVDQRHVPLAVGERLVRRRLERPAEQAVAQRARARCVERAGGGLRHRPRGEDREQERGDREG